jgi:hypothetical protein
MRTSDRVDLAGRLETIPFTELLQFLDQTRRRGLITLVASSGELAHCALTDGGLVQARVGHLHGAEAALAMLSWHGGRFEFVEDRDIPSREPPLAVIPLVMEAARLEDELERHLPRGPTEHTKLVLVDPNGRPDDPLDTGVGEVFDEIVRRPAVTLTDLVAALDLAPVKVRLAVAWLGVTGLLRSKTSVAPPAMQAARDVADWYGEMLIAHPGGVRVLIASSPALSSREVAAMVHTVAAELRVAPGPLALAADGPSMVRLRPPAGGLVSLTFLPMKAKHRVVFETFARTADFVLITEACPMADTGWEVDAPLHIPRAMLPPDSAPATLLDALVALARRKSARRLRLR